MKISVKIIFVLIIFFGFLFMLIGVASPFYIESRFLIEDKYQNLGPIGDWLGGSSTPFFTLASFFILVAALLAQMAELKATREEFSQQNKEFKEQNKLLGIQRFESTFFQMVSLHHQIINSVENVEEIMDYSGMQGIRTSAAVVQRGRQVLTKKASNYGILSTQLNQDAEKLVEKFNIFYESNEDILGHYFRNLYHIVMFIDNSRELIVYDDQNNINDLETKKERKKYIRILRAQLSTTEMLLLLYNSLTEQGEAFYSLIVEYKLLNNLRKNVIPPGLHEIFNQMNQN